jgi:hypothetical protein
VGGNGSWLGSWQGWSCGGGLLRRPVIASVARMGLEVGEVPKKGQAGQRLPLRQRLASFKVLRRHDPDLRPTRLSGLLQPAAAAPAVPTFCTLAGPAAAPAVHGA